MNMNSIVVVVFLGMLNAGLSEFGKRAIILMVSLLW